MVIGADGANSRVAKDIGAGEYDYAIAFQVCVYVCWVLGEGGLSGGWGLHAHAHTHC